MSITLTHESHTPSIIGPRYTAENSIPPHWREQRLVTGSECVRVVRVPHSPFRLFGVIEGSKT